MVDEMPRRMAKYGEPVRLRVRADFDQLPVVRALTRTLAARADFTPDEIADITLAADEVCTQLITSARPGSDLHCTVTPAEHRLRITIAARVEHPGVPRRQGIGWHVLDTLTDSLSVSESPADTDPTGWDVVVDFVKHRAIELGRADDRGQPVLTCPSASRSARPGTCTG